MSHGEETLYWGRVKATFERAFELDEAGREHLLAELAEDDPSLGEEVASLLAALERAGPEDEPTLGPDARLPDLADDTPRRLGRYRVRERLGRGGMGEVLLAHDPILDRDVALKLLPADFGRDTRRSAAFLREARAAAGLNHPHITTIHEIGQADGRDYIALEYVDGPTLRQWLRQRTPALPDLLELALPLAEALAFAHDRGIVHRDVKASNVMLTGEGSPKLLDFGLAKQLHTTPADGARAPDASELGDDRQTAAIFGTPGAMSPEQSRGEPVDARSDVFSFGILLYELAAGRAPFAGDTALRTITAVQQSEPPPLAELRPDLPPGFAELVELMLRKDPAERPADMHVVHAALDDLRAPAPSARGGRRPTGVLALLVVVLAACAWWWLPTRAEPAGDGPPAGRYTAVLTFTNLDDPTDADHTGAMLTRLLTAHLSTADTGLPMLSAQRLADVARSLESPEGTLAVDASARLARHAGVGTMILGEVGLEGGAHAARLRIVDVASGDELGRASARAEGAEAVFALAESLSRHVRLALSAPQLTDNERHALDLQLTTSVEAYRAFIRGCADLQVSRIEDAVVSFREATTLDPAFALAHYRLYMALIWTGRFDETDAAMERCLAFRDNMPEDVRLLIDLIGPYFTTDESRHVIEPLESLLERDPYHRDALYVLGEVYTHSSTRSDASRCVALYEQLIELEPRFELVYEHLLTAYLRTGRNAEARARVDSWRDASTEVLDDLQGTLALWEGRLDAACELLPDPTEALILSGDQDTLTSILSGDVASWLEHADSLGSVARTMSLDRIGHVLVTHGRLEEAVEVYDAAATTDSTWSRDGYMSNLRSAARLRRARVLEHLGRLDEARSDIAAVLEQQPDTFRFLYQAGAFALRDGDGDRARELLTELRRLEQLGWSPTGELYADALAAEVALAGGRAAEARDAFAALLASGRTHEDWYAFHDSVAPALRAGLARACLAADDPDGAAAALDDLLAAGLERMHDPLVEVRARLVRGRLAARAGDEERARTLLEGLVDDWRAHAHGSPEVADALSALARLGALPED